MSWTFRKKISPSLICLDLLDIRKSVQEIMKGGADMLHVDIIDGHFSPSMPLGLDTVKQLKKEFPDLNLDVHVMVKDNWKCLDDLLELRPYQITFQLETLDHPFETFEIFSNVGSRVGIALQPGTPTSAALEVLNVSDVILFMRIEPGFASKQEVFVYPGVDRKIREIADIAKKLDISIEVDGRVDLDYIRKNKDVVDIFVAGSSCLDKNALAASVRALRSEESCF